MRSEFSLGHSFENWKVHIMSKNPSSALEGKVREDKWEKLNAASGGKFQARVIELINRQPKLTVEDARIKTLAEEGWTAMKIAISLDLEEQTVRNHVSRMRLIAGAPRKMQFRLVFVVPVEEWIAANPEKAD